MFEIIDFNFSGYLNWQEFLNLMVVIKAKTLVERVNLFIKIADKDGNQSLSQDEVFTLTRICLLRYVKVLGVYALYARTMVMVFLIICVIISQD
jgi:hypothetical protein